MECLYPGGAGEYNTELLSGEEGTVQWCHLKYVTLRWVGSGGLGGAERRNTPWEMMSLKSLQYSAVNIASCCQGMMVKCSGTDWVSDPPTEGGGGTSWCVACTHLFNFKEKFIIHKEASGWSRPSSSGLGHLAVGT